MASPPITSPFGTGNGVPYPVPPAPVAPTDLVATRVGSEGFLLTWTGPTPFLYRVAVGPQLILGVEETSLLVTGLEPATAYPVTVSVMDVPADVVRTSAPITVATLAADGTVPETPNEPDPEQPPTDPQPEEPSNPTPTQPIDPLAEWDGVKILSNGSSEGIVVAKSFPNNPDYVRSELWNSRVATKLHTTLVNQNDGGRVRIDVALALLKAGASAFTPGVYGLIMQSAGGNDVAYSWDTEAGKRGFKHATSALLGIYRSRSKVKPGTKETGKWAQAQYQYSGATRESTTKGSTNELSFTGRNATLILQGYTDISPKSFAGSDFTVSVDGQQVATGSTKRSGVAGSDKAQNTVVPVHLRNLPYGSHKVVVTHTGVNGDPLIVDSLHVWYEDKKDMPFVLMLPPGQTTRTGLLLYPSPRPTNEIIKAFRRLQDEVFEEFGQDKTFGTVAASLLDTYFPPNVPSLRLEDGLHPNKAGHLAVYQAVITALATYRPTKYSYGSATEPTPTPTPDPTPTPTDPDVPPEDPTTDPEDPGPIPGIPEFPDPEPEGPDEEDPGPIPGIPEFPEDPDNPGTPTTPTDPTDPTTPPTDPTTPAPGPQPAPPDYPGGPSQPPYIGDLPRPVPGILRVVAFSADTGTRLGRIPGTFTYEDILNEYGRISVTGTWTEEARALSVWEKTAAQRTMLAVLDGDRVVCGGPVIQRTPTPTGYEIVATASIGRIFENVLTLNPELEERYQEGAVVIDEDNPAPEWFLTFNGSYADIAVQLIETARFWRGIFMPVLTPQLTGGPYTRTYEGWQLFTVASRLQLLTELVNGIEMRYEGKLGAGGNITFELHAGEDVHAFEHDWNATLPDVDVMLVQAPEDASLLASDVWAFGGRDEDVVITARSRTEALTSQGYPVMQMGLTEYSDVSQVSTLKAYTDERAQRGSTFPEVYQFQVHRRYGVRAGDWAHVTFVHPALGEMSQALKVLSISGGVGEWVTINTRSRFGV